MSENILTAIIVAAIALIFLAIVISSVRKSKKAKANGEFTCSGGCAGCNGKCNSYEQYYKG